MKPLDWIIITSLFIGLNIVGWYCKRYVNSVADFLVAGRNAGRYLGLTASGMAGLGAITILAFFQMYYLAGFAGGLWGIMGLPISIFIALMGWGVYKFRQTRVMTMAEMFERRYSRRFRIFFAVSWLLSPVLLISEYSLPVARDFLYTFAASRKQFIFTASQSLSSFCFIMS